MSKVIHKTIKSKLYIIYSAFPALLLAVTLFGSASTAFAEKVTYNVRIEPTLNIAVSTNRVQLLLNPSSNPFNTGDLDITVSTNNPNGYKLYVNANDTRLTNNTYSEPAYLATLSSSATESSFPTNSWGYQISSGSTGDQTITSTTDFYPFVPGTLISSSSTQTTDDETTLTFAAKAGYDRPSGSYTLDLAFKALPIITTYTMQNLDPEVCVEEPTIVTDSRDGQSYAIARLEDGKCWMLQNLKLGKTEDNITLTSVDSAVENTFTLSSDLAGAEGKFGGTARTDDSVVGGTVWVRDHSEYYCMNDYGCYYNWYTATAGSGKGGYGNGSPATGANVTVDYSICPAGWNLPTGGSGGEFEALASAYGYSSSATDEEKAEVAANMLVSNPATTVENINGSYLPGLLFNGIGASNGITNSGVNGQYWSRTSYSIGYGYFLGITTSAANPLSRHNKYLGFAVRCLLTEPQS